MTPRPPAAGLRRHGLLAPIFGLALAAIGFGRAFRGPPDRFWDRMTANGAVLGTFALLSAPELAAPRWRPWEIPLGGAIAAVLYGIFALGDRIARRVLPSGGREIESIYALRGDRPAGELAARLALVIAPAEEIFWRGMLQGVLMRRVGRWRGAALTNVAYAGVHVATGNLTLIGAAGTAGAFWSALRAAGVPLGSLIVSHVAWDVWIFLVKPTSGTRPPAARPHAVVQRDEAAGEPPPSDIP